MAHHQVVDEGYSLQIWRVAANIFRTPDCGWGEGLTTHHKKKTACYTMLHRDLELAGPCKHSNESLGSIKGGEFCDQLSDY
jgi:hypothetical protein